MRCRSGVITISSIEARAHARIDQGTAIRRRVLFEFSRRVSGLVQLVLYSMARNRMRALMA
jgi:hypothetical protein